MVSHPTGLAICLLVATILGAVRGDPLDHWTNVSPAQPANYYVDFIAAAYGAGRFLMVGNDGWICTSPDGLAWAWQRLPAAIN